MVKNLLKSILFISVFALMTICVNAQGEASTANGRPPQKEELPKNIQETLRKQEILKAKKDHEEMLKNSEEAIKLSKELETSYEKTNNLSVEDRKKLERLEKLLKKIRRELGGDDDNKAESEMDEDKPSTVITALNKLQTSAMSLFDELKKTSRFSISVVAIQSSNALLKIVRFLRFTK
jgi:vancomycin resistance protein YoaR